MDFQNKNSLEKLISSALAQQKPSTTNQLNFKQSKPVASSPVPKAAPLKPEPPLIPGKNCEIVAMGPLTTWQNAQKYFQSPTTPQSADQNGSMSQYLVHPQGNMMNTAMPNAMTIPTNSTCLFF